MDIEAKKIKSPYKPSSDYFSDLALKIQQKVGIEALDLGIKQENVTFKPVVNEPIQLTVEFGFPLTTQRSSEPDISMPEAPLPEISNLPTEIEIQTVEAEAAELATEDPLPTTKDPLPATINQLPELEFSDEDLDRLHAEMTGESFVPPTTTGETRNNAVTSESPKTTAVETPKTVNAERAEERVSIWAMIPWSSLLGVVASLFAVAGAWFVWSQIQKPLTVEQRMAKAVQMPAVTAAVKASPEKKELNIDALPASHQIIYDLIQEGATANNNNMNFNQMPEQSRISSVELERNGLTVLDLEDQIFEEIEL